MAYQKYNRPLLALLTLALLYFTLATTIHDAEHQLHAEMGDCPVELHSNGHAEQRLVNLSEHIVVVQGYAPIIALPRTTFFSLAEFSAHPPRAPPV